MNLADPSTLKALLSRHNLWASKGLGQHFLVSQKVVSAIVSSLAGFDGILEIGPGPGVLTSPLSETCEKLIALELDARMPAVLRDSAPRATVLQKDALKTDLSEILLQLPEPRAVVSNLPYYITGLLLTEIAEARKFYGKAVLMMQKEVADRVLAGPKSSARGSLSVYLQMQFEIRLLIRAPAGAFLPPPKVDSAVLEFLPKSGETEEGLFKLVRLAFVQPRKTLANNFVSGLQMDRVKALSLLDRAGFGEKARPQELSNQEWQQLYEAYADSGK